MAWPAVNNSSGTTQDITTMVKTCNYTIETAFNDNIFLFLTTSEWNNHVDWIYIRQ